MLVALPALGIFIVFAALLLYFARIQPLVRPDIRRRRYEKFERFWAKRLKGRKRLFYILILVIIYILSCYITFLIRSH